MEMTIEDIKHCLKVMVDCEVCEECNLYGTTGTDHCFEDALEYVIKDLEQEPRKGHWIRTGDYYTGAYGSIEYVECSCCHEDSLEEGDFCPNCGAAMRER